MVITLVRSRRIYRYEETLLHLSFSWGPVVEFVIESIVMGWQLARNVSWKSLTEFTY